MSTNSELKQGVRHLLRYGKENARTGKELAKILGSKDDRPVRLVIRDLIAEGLPVASSVTPPFGFFIVNSLDEVKDYMRVLKGRLVQDAYRRRDFKLASKEILQPHQMVLI